MTPAPPDFFRLLEQHRHSFPGKLAVVHGELRLDYAQLHDRTTRCATALQRLGVEPGARVLWLGQNSHVLIELLAACSRLGAMLCCANWRQSTDELAFVLRDFAPHLVVWQQMEIGAGVASARAAVPETTPHWYAVDSDDEHSYEHLIAQEGRASALSIREASADHDDALLVLYTARLKAGRMGRCCPAPGYFCRPWCTRTRWSSPTAA